MDNTLQTKKQGVQQGTSQFFQSKGSGTFFGVTQQKSFFGNTAQRKTEENSANTESSELAETSQMKSEKQSAGGAGASGNDSGNNSPLVPYQFKKSDSSTSSGGGGSSNKLPELVQLKMEGAMGRDFSDVNITTNSSKATEMGAKAFTQGKDVHFAPGQFKPDTTEGQRLIGHEYAHVDQQAKGNIKPTTETKQGAPVNDDPGLERQADVMGDKAASFNPSGNTVQKKSASSSPSGGGTSQMKPAVQMKPAIQMKPMPGAEPAMEEPAAEGPVAEAPAKQMAGGAAGDPGAGGGAPPADMGGGGAVGGGGGGSVGGGGGGTGGGNKKMSLLGGGGGAAAGPVAMGGGGEGGPAGAFDVAGGGGSVAEYLRKMSESKLKEAKDKIKELAKKHKKADPAKKKKVDSEKAAVAPSKEGQAKSNTQQVDTSSRKQKPKTSKEKAKSNFQSKLNSSLPKKVKDVLKFKKSKKAKKIGKAVMDVISVDKNKVMDTYKDMKKRPSPKPNAKSTPMPSLEKLEATPQMNLGKGLVPELKQEHTDFSEYTSKSDKAVKDQGITDEHLNMVTFGDLAQARESKTKIKTKSKTANSEANKVRQEKLGKLDQDLQQEEQKGRKEMLAEREKELNLARGKQSKAKGDFEQTRGGVTKHINNIYDSAKSKVEQRLKNLEGAAFKKFEQGQNAATKKFEDNVDSRMSALKKKRYKGFKGKLRWVKDKIMGIGSVKEVKQLIDEERTTYVNTIDKLVEEISKNNEKVINECRQTIDDAKKKIDDYVDGLPSDLKAVGEKAEQEIDKKLDDLEKKVNEKEQDLQQKLAEKREEAIKAIDEKIAKMKKEMGGLLSKLVNLLLDAALKFLRWALESAGLDADPIIATIKNIAGAIIKIVKNPVGFLKNLISAVGGGFKQFGSNIKENLMATIGPWLTGKLGVAGIEFPAKFDIKGIMKMVLSVLGVSWSNIKNLFNEQMGGDFIGKIESGVGMVQGFVQTSAESSGEGGGSAMESIKSMGEDKLKEKMTEKVGAQRMGQLEMVVKLVKDVMSEGPGAIIDFVKEEGSELKAMGMEALGGIKEMVIGGIKDWVKKNLIEKGIQKIISFLVPAGGIVQAIIGIYKSITFFLENRSGLKQLVSSVVGALGMVVNGNVAGAAAKIKDSIMLAIPLLLDFVMKLLNLNGIFEAVKKTIGKAVVAVNGFIKKVVAWVAKLVKKVMAKVQGWIEKLKNKATSLIPGQGKDDDVPDYGDPQKKAKVEAGLAKVDEEQAKRAEGGKITEAKAKESIEAVKASPEGAIFSKLEAFDNESRWDIRWAASPTQVKRGLEKEEVTADQLPDDTVSFEFFAHQVAYSPDETFLNENLAKVIENSGYNPDRRKVEIRRGTNGFQAVLVLPKEGSHKNPMLAIRGTASVSGALTDTDFIEVGCRQYNNNKEPIIELINIAKANGGKVNVTGHSLGGAMAQIITAYHTADVNKTVTFQSPGISYLTLMEFNKTAKEDQPEVVHHIANNDVVDLAGDANLPGVVYKHNLKDWINFISAHTSWVTATDQFTEQRAKVGLVDGVMVQDIGKNIRTEETEITKYNQHPHGFKRAAVESVRRRASIILSPVRGAEDFWNWLTDTEMPKEHGKGPKQMVEYMIDEKEKFKDILKVVKGLISSDKEIIANDEALLNKLEAYLKADEYLHLVNQLD